MVVQPAPRDIGHSGRASVSAWWTLTIVTFLYIMSVVAHYLITMLVGPMKAALRLSDLAIGFAIGPAFFAVFAICGLGAGWLADRTSRRGVLLGGVILFSVGQALCGFATSLTALVLARALVGLGASAIHPAAMSLMAEKFSRSQLPAAAAIYGAANKLGVGATFAIGGATIAWATSLADRFPILGSSPWRTTYLLTGVLMGLLGLSVLTLRERTGAERAAGTPPGLSHLTIAQFMWRERAFFLPSMVGFTIMGACVAGLIAWVPTYLTRHFGLAPARYGSLLGLISTASMGAQIVIGAVMNRLYRRGWSDITIRFYTWLILASSPAIVLAFLVRDLALFYLLYAVVAIVTLTFGAYVFSSTMMVAPPHLRGRAAAIVTFPIYAFGGLGPLIIGWLTDLVVRNEAGVGWSIESMLCTFVPAAFLCLRASMAPLRRLVAEIATDSEAMR